MTTENVTNRTVKAPPKTGQNAAPGGISRPQLALRGTSLEDPLLVVTDGAPGLIRAVEECFPRAERQRCLAHRMRNLASKISEPDWPEVRAHAKACKREALPPHLLTCRGRSCAT